MKTQQYLTFSLGRRVYAIGILAIKEIIEYTEPTELPMMPACLRGVINLRGAAVPVADLATRLHKPSAEITKRTCIVVVEVEREERTHVIGVQVDEVNAVLEIPESDIESAPSFGTNIRSDFIAGMARVDGNFVVLLDTARVLAFDDLALQELELTLPANTPATAPTPPPAFA
ncbi:chemotaxis protein CheW [Peristeroidobacter soli]|uniref:chemotaxis protein CheW n=1 Tax=Peristeroidobacter soli TaxID=2497877 RepID=UPI001C378373|nr:chemotaxis protein CheW [Peristeroidobacter soli]